MLPLKPEQFEQFIPGTDHRVITGDDKQVDLSKRTVDILEALTVAGVNDPTALLRKKHITRPGDNWQMPTAEVVTLLRTTPGATAAQTIARREVASYLEQTGELPVSRHELRAAEQNPRVAAELCELLGLSSVVHVRTVGEGRARRFSLVDVAVLLSGKAPTHALEDVRAVQQSHFEVNDGIVNFKFGGQGQRETPVADLQTTLLVVLRLRSRAAQRLSAKVVDVFCRFVGGDPVLSQEILTNREFQEQLAEEQPDHPARAFGEAVECPEEQPREPSPVPPLVLPRYLLDARPAGGPGADDLYVMQNIDDPLLLKVGRSKDAAQRLRGVQYQHGHHMALRVVWRQDAELEGIVHAALAEHTATVGRSREFFRVVLEEVERAVTWARETRECACRDAEEPEYKRRRMAVSIGREELALQKEQLDVQAQALDLEERMLALQEASWAFELRKRREAEVVGSCVHGPVF